MRNSYDFRLPVLWIVLFLSTASMSNPRDSHPVEGHEGPRLEDKIQPRRIVLLGSPRDHPPGTHEYFAGLRVIEACLAQVDGVESVILPAYEQRDDWDEKLSGAKAIVGFFHGEKVYNNTKLRGAIDAELSGGAGFVLLHMAMQGNGPAGQWLQRSVGGYHGESDRKYKTVQTECRLTSNHPVTCGLNDFKVRDEFYYTLKFVSDGDAMAPLVRVRIDDEEHTVGWTWTHPGGGRSVGFSGCHYHDNFARPEYRRLITQAILWAARRHIPGEGVSVEVTPDVLALEDPVEDG